MKRNIKLFFLGIICVLGAAFFFSFAIDVAARFSINCDKSLEEFDQYVSELENKEDFPR